MSRIVVIGGGIIGRAAAYRLQKSGHAVTLVAIPDLHPASWGNAGHIATEQITPLARFSTLRRALTERFPAGPVAIDWQRPATLLPWSLRFMRACLPDQTARGDAALSRLMRHALPAWERLVTDLDAPDLLDRYGVVKLWEGPRARAVQLAAQSADHGTARAMPLDEAEFSAIRDRIAVPLDAGLRYQGTAHVTDPRCVLDTLFQAFLNSGGKLIEAEALSIQRRNGVIRVETTRGAEEADHVVLACGVRSATLIPFLHAPLIAERGYHIQWAHGGNWALPNLIFENRALVVTRFGAQLRATSFVEFTSPDSPPDPRKWLWLEDQVRRLGLPVASPFTRWHGARPTLPDYLPAIGPSRTMPGLHAAYGHNHLGLTLAAITAEMLADSIAGRTPMRAFSPDRFGRPLLRKMRKQYS